MGEEDDLVRHLPLIQGGERPGEQEVQPPVGVVVAGEAHDEFAQIHGGGISAEIGAERQVSGQEFGLADQQ